LLENVIHSFVCGFSLLGAAVNQGGKLFELGALKQVDIHQVDKSAAVLNLLLSFIERSSQCLQGLIAESLGNSLHKCFKVER
jgi:hypothetical protein